MVLIRLVRFGALCSIFSVRPEGSLAPGTLGLNAAQRRIVKVSTGDKLVAEEFIAPTADASFQAAVVNAEIDFISKKAIRGPDVELDAAALTAHLLSRFATQVITVRQEITFEFQGVNYQLVVGSVVGANPRSDDLTMHRGLLLPDSTFVFEARHGGGIKITGQRSAAVTHLFKHKEFNFEKLGIGGLDSQFEQIFRRAFASRIFPPAMVERLGIHHVKGVLLHGPPGIHIYIFVFLHGHTNVQTCAAFCVSLSRCCVPQYVCCGSMKRSRRLV
jgi:vesicle-fusing ATPase